MKADRAAAVERQHRLAKIVLRSCLNKKVTPPYMTAQSIAIILTTEYLWLLFDTSTSPSTR